MKNFNAPQNQTKRNILVAAFAVALAVGSMVALLQPAQAATVTPPPVPDDIAVPAGAVAFLVAPAVGTQNYVCLPSGSGFAFSLFTPEATLFKTDVDQQIITHFFSPNPAENGTIRATWQDSLDTSRFWGKATAFATSKTDPKFVDPNAIAWVLLPRAGVLDGPDGGNRLSETTFVQRVNTKGGLAPSTGCASLSDVGKQAFIPYTADYVFYHGGLN